MLILLFHVTKTKNLENRLHKILLCRLFTGLDNVIPGLLCNQPGNLLDGMPVNFKFPLDASSLSETDFEVLDSLEIYIPLFVFLWPQLMKTEKIELCFWVNLAPLLPIHLLKLGLWGFIYN